MNSLQVGLIAVGAVVVALLAVWSWWQTQRKNSEREPKALRPAVVASAEHRVNVDASSVQPVETRDPDAIDDQQWARGMRSDSIDVGENDSTDIASATPSAQRQTSEYVQSGYSDAERARTAANPSQTAAQIPAAVVSSMPFDERLHAYAIITGIDGQPLDVAPFLRIAGRASTWGRLFRQSPWEAIDLSQPTGAVHSLCLALPIASRGGPVTDAEFDGWRTSVAVECARQSCAAHFEGFTAAAARAAELDEFLAAVDCIPIVYLIRKDGGQWSGTRLRGTLEANGFRLQTDGRFAYHEVETEEAIFYAVDGYERAFTPERLRTESITAFRLVMEVALLDSPLQRFDVYRQTLRALSKLLDAELRDSSGANVGEAEFAELRTQVQSSCDALTAADIAPGSPSAVALLS
jgi:FtsZ-interacting cell division protein ZipA